MLQDNEIRVNWDDFRYVLAVARFGSVSGAARDLGVNHATVLRRVAAVETALGKEIFRKSVRGYEVLPETMRLVDATRDVEAAVGIVKRLAHHDALELQGGIGISTTELLAAKILPDMLFELAQSAPSLTFDVVTQSHDGPQKCSSDVVIRPCYKLPEGMQGAVAAQIPFGFYAKDADVPEDHWLGLKGAVARALPAQKLREKLDRHQSHIAATADSFLTLLGLAEAGFGRAMLPCFLGDASDRLVPVAPLLSVPAMPIYVASPTDFADAPRLRQARSLISEALGQHPAFSTGAS